MMRALTQFYRKIEIHRAARPEKDRRPLGREARPVGSDQHVAGEPVLVLPADFAQPRRADLLARLDQERRIESEPPARLQHTAERRQVDRVLALVVGGAAAVEPTPLLLYPPRREPRLPLWLE